MLCVFGVAAVGTVESILKAFGPHENEKLVDDSTLSDDFFFFLAAVAVTATTSLHGRNQAGVMSRVAFAWDGARATQVPYDSALVQGTGTLRPKGLLEVDVVLVIADDRPCDEQCTLLAMGRVRDLIRNSTMGRVLVTTTTVTAAANIATTSGSACCLCSAVGALPPRGPSPFQVRLFALPLAMTTCLGDSAVDLFAIAEGRCAVDAGLGCAVWLLTLQPHVVISAVLSGLGLPDGSVHDDLNPVVLNPTVTFFRPMLAVDAWRLGWLPKNASRSLNLAWSVVGFPNFVSQPLARRRRYRGYAYLPPPPNS